jgi:hypothetical protein
VIAGVAPAGFGVEGVTAGVAPAGFGVEGMTAGVACGGGALGTGAFVAAAGLADPTLIAIGLCELLTSVEHFLKRIEILTIFAD